jgi:hypothetical protein
MTPITKWPLGSVVATYRLARDTYVLDFIRFKHGSQTRFVEVVWRAGQRVAFRMTDEMPADKVADRFLEGWLDTKIKQEDYVLIARNEKEPPSTTSSLEGELSGIAQQQQAKGL